MKVNEMVICFYKKLFNLLYIKYVIIVIYIKKNYNNV